MIMVKKRIIADNIIGSCSQNQESNKDFNNNVTTIASTNFRENLIPQTYVDIQKISHFYRNWIEHQNDSRQLLNE